MRELQSGGKLPRDRRFYDVPKAAGVHINAFQITTCWYLEGYFRRRQCQYNASIVISHMTKNDGNPHDLLQPMVPAADVGKLDEAHSGESHAPRTTKIGFRTAMSKARMELKEPTFFKPQSMATSHTNVQSAGSQRQLIQINAV